MASRTPEFAGGLQNVLRLTEQALRAGDMNRAMQLAGDAVAKGAEHPNLLTLATYRALGTGSPEQAVAYAMRARQLAPRDPDVLQAVAVALASAKRPREALGAYDQALRHAPNTTAIRYNRARLLEEIREVGRAKREYERVLDAEPSHPGALARLASIAASLGEIASARDYAERALRVQPSEAAGVLALAQADLNEKKFEAVGPRVAALAGPQNSNAINRAIAQGLMADALDGMGKLSEAFDWYTASNQTLKSAYAREFEAVGAETALARARRVANYFRNAPDVPWLATDVATRRAPVATHVFLLGFPRSGTTLLEQVLASHPKIESLEERDCLVAAENEFLASNERLDALANAESAELDKFRDAYWSEARAGGIALDRPVFVDKMPLNSLLLGIIARLFPEAKILLAIRDPRDVVLSCFRRRFGMSANMYELLTLDRAAAFYAAIMDICSIAQRKFSLQFAITRYEDLVGDLESESRRICAFLGLEYDPGMRDFAQRARGRVINTPSAAQVARGLYKHGIGQWVGYRERLAGVMPVLAPWVAQFGYSENT